MGFSEAIYLLYGNRIDENSDGSFNEMISCEINSKNELQLKRTMTSYGDKENNDIDSIVEDIWIYHIKNNIEI
jgi:hypothetical protein